MTIREKTLKKKDNRLAIVRCAEQQRILIRPNTSVSIKGYLNQETEYQPTGAVLEATQKSVLTDDLDIAPTVITYNFKDTEDRDALWNLFLKREQSLAIPVSNI
ncbi:Hypothetical predicted protein [Mytilus galloprovincialis]|uniref:Uncharacterized protein n=1 Tax=Mytilus galloprovincialis TaxID=29158 RepID=A0A8B6BL49_MYTGA|nr:Hypothetical predicted protein [Mytilus galloprovincialis]